MTLSAGSCVAFANMAAIETCFKKVTGVFGEMVLLIVTRMIMTLYYFYLPENTDVEMSSLENLTINSTIFNLKHCKLQRLVICLSHLLN